MINLNYQMVLILFHIQVYIECIIKKYEKLTTISPIHVYINRINNKLAFKIKDRYKLELKMPETIFGNTKNVIDKQKMEKKYQVLK